MDVLTDVLDRVRLKGTVLFNYELGRPWSLSLPRFPDAVFHYLSRGSASLALESCLRALQSARLTANDGFAKRSTCSRSKSAHGAVWSPCIAFSSCRIAA